MHSESDLTHSPPIEFAATGSIRRSLLERMPTWLICIPLVLQWIVLAVRNRSATFPSAANSAITSGGLVGEGKLEYSRNMGPLARAAWQCHRRAWFICPANGCGRRVAKLYLGSSGSFACRHCIHLAYASQRETVFDRALRLTKNIRKELGWEPSFMALHRQESARSGPWRGGAVKGRSSA